MATIKEIIIRVLASFDISFDECLVADIEIEVRRICHSNPEGLAYAIARNKASDIISKRMSEKRRVVKELLRKEKERQEQELLARLKKEFVEMEPVISDNVSPCARNRAKRNIDLCFLRVFERMHVVDIKERFYPDLSVVCIRKGIQRGRNMFLREYLSAELRKSLTSTYATSSEKTSF